jgi:hypothetical protein
LITTEFKLLTECCRRAFSSGDPEVVRELGRAADWQRLVRLARFHRVQGLVRQALARADLLGSPETSALSADAETIAADNLRQAAECGEICERAAAQGIPLLFLKGLTLGTLAYGDPYLKMGWDIDLLVAEDDLAGASELLRSRGYELLAPRSAAKLDAWHRRCKESHWAKRSGALHVELHTRVADNGQLIPGITVHSPTQSVEVAPGIALRTLAGDELFAYLCAHGASSAWFRLKWITDFAALLQGCPPAEIERLYRRSQQLGACRSAGQALLLADALYGTLEGTGLRESLATGRATAILANAALRQLTGRAEPI